MLASPDAEGLWHCGAFFGNLLAAAAENARMNRENIECQLADEVKGCMQPYRVWEAATESTKGLL